MKNTELFTVITGASRGLGKCLATECAKRGRNLILIAMPYPKGIWVNAICWPEKTLLIRNSSGKWPRFQESENF